MSTKFFAHETADIAPGATIGDGTKIWHHVQIHKEATIGSNCVLGKDVYIDYAVRIGNNVKIQNGVSVYQGVTLEDGVFCGPHCVFTNDLVPRAITPDGVLKTTNEWHVTETRVRTGASIGANATVVCGVTIGRWAMVGAGAVVTADVPDHGLVYGTPARLKGFVCACGTGLEPVAAVSDAPGVAMTCGECGARVVVEADDYSRILRHRDVKC